jgi:hypothetical protein
VNSFLGHAVLSAFASLEQEEPAPAGCTGSLTAGVSAALSTEGRPVSGPLPALAAAANTSPAVQENLEYSVFVNNFLRVHMTVSEQCRRYDRSLLSEPHVIVLNSPSTTDGTIEPDSEEEDVIEAHNGVAVDMSVFSRGIISSLETLQDSDKTDDPSLQDFRTYGGPSWMRTSPN